MNRTKPNHMNPAGPEKDSCRMVLNHLSSEHDTGTKVLSKRSSTKPALALIMLLALLGVAPGSISTVAAQVMGEGVVLNGNSGEKGKAVGTEKKKEGDAAAAEGNALSKIGTENSPSTTKPPFNTTTPPKFSTKGLPKRRSGDPTAGWLRKPDDKGGWINQKVGSSRMPGVSRPDRGWPNKAWERYGRGAKSQGFDLTKWVSKHAEGQAAGLMKQGEKAWLDINHNYICDQCKAALQRILPRDAELVVRYVEEGVVKTELFVGTSPLELTPR